MRRIQTAQVQYDSFALRGGLDQVTPVLSLSPGVARSMLNFEASVTGGYTRISGYERYDGQTSPSAADYAVVTLTDMSNVAVGDTIRNAGSTASGVVIATSGDNVIFTMSVGEFTIGEDVYVGASVVAQVAEYDPGFSPTEMEQAQYKALAADEYRLLVQAVPGSGPVRGVLRMDGVTYAWRNNAAATAMEIHRSTSSGWSAVSLGYEMTFTTGVSTDIVDGATITNATGTATATVARVVLTSGTTWIGGSGKLILSAVTGTWVTGDQIRVSGTQKATAGSAATAITLAPNGRVQAVLDNVAGYYGAGRAYGCDGVNKGFEFDGNVYVPISTGMPVDTPENVAVHKNCLFFTYSNSVQHSGVGTPYVWSVIFGAAEIAMPDTVTAIQAMPGSDTGGALAIFTENNTHVLYGTPGAWSLQTFNRGLGAEKYSVQSMTEAYVLDQGGVVGMRAAQEFGNFSGTFLTLSIRPYMQARRGLCSASGLNRGKSQYRVFYSDGSGVYLTIVNGRMMGSCPVLFPTTVRCWAEGETAAGKETSFFGGDDGYVYELDCANDFDGVGIDAYVSLNFALQGNSRVLKRYRRAAIEVAGEAYAEFDFGYSLAYDSTSIGQPVDGGYSVSMGSVSWDNFTWDTFNWDGRTLAPVEIECNGTGENISLAVRCSSRLTTTFTINSATLHYSVRRGIR